MAKKPTTSNVRKAIRCATEALTDLLREAREPICAMPGAHSIHREASSLAHLLDRLMQELDPIRPPSFALDPSKPETVGRLIARWLEDEPAIPLATAGLFYGSGIYAIYYSGDFPAYRAVSGARCPIYIGKADPDSPDAKSPKEQGTRLSGRLAEHAKSIRKAKNLDLADFICRYLVFQSGWQKAVEDYLISVYRPVWNNEIGVCPGIGKHGDAARRERSCWDIMHPGRGWAEEQSSRSGQTADAIAARVLEHFESLLRDRPEHWRELLNQDWVQERLSR